MFTQQFYGRSYIAAPRATSRKSRPSRSVPATDKQIAFITKLADERGVANDAAYSPTGLTQQGASQVISALLALPKAKAAPSADALTVGMYRTQAGDIFKVQESAAGRLYAKALQPIGGQRLTETDAVVHFEFTYAPGAVQSLTASDRLTLDDAKAFGIKYGVCCVCGARLKDADSVAAGIGPICATRL